MIYTPETISSTDVPDRRTDSGQMAKVNPVINLKKFIRWLSRYDHGFMGRCFPTLRNFDPTLLGYASLNRICSPEGDCTSQSVIVSYDNTLNIHRDGDFKLVTWVSSFGTRGPVTTWDPAMFFNIPGLGHLRHLMIYFTKALYTPISNVGQCDIQGTSLCVSSWVTCPYTYKIKGV